MNEIMKRFVKGLIMERNSVVGSIPMAVMLAGKHKQEEQTPIAYSYNGIVLPDINTVWDKETYPYVSIHYYSFGVLYTAIFSEKPIRCIDNGEGSVDFLTFDSDAKYKQYSCDVSYDPTTYEPIVDDKWVFAYSGTAEDRFPQYDFMGNDVWANHDIIVYGGSSIYLSESEPIPVYE